MFVCDCLSVVYRRYKYISTCKRILITLLLFTCEWWLQVASNRGTDGSRQHLEKLIEQLIFQFWFWIEQLNWFSNSDFGLNNSTDFPILMANSHWLFLVQFSTPKDQRQIRITCKLHIFGEEHFKKVENLAESIYLLCLLICLVTDLSSKAENG